MHVDGPGAHELTAAAGVDVSKGLLYVGEARKQTLHKHLVGHTNIGQHTLRWSLAALLARPLRIRPATRNVLDPASKERLAAWMAEHLRVVFLPLGAEGEIDALVRDLDPQLNLTRAGPSPLRGRVSDARAGLIKNAPA